MPQGALWVGGGGTLPLHLSPGRPRGSLASGASRERFEKSGSQMMEEITDLTFRDCFLCASVGSFVGPFVGTFPEHPPLSRRHSPTEMGAAQ